MQLSSSDLSYLQPFVKLEVLECADVDTFDRDIESLHLPPSPARWSQILPGGLPYYFTDLGYSSSGYGSNPPAVQSSDNLGLFSSSDSTYCSSSSLASPTHDDRAEHFSAAPTPDEITMYDWSSAWHHSASASIPECMESLTTSSYSPYVIPSTLADDNEPGMVSTNHPDREAGPTMGRPKKMYICHICRHGKHQMYMSSSNIRDRLTRSLVSTRKFNLDSHMKTHDPPEERQRFFCEKPCNKSYTRRSDLKRHVLDKHQGPSSSTLVGVTR